MQSAVLNKLNSEKDIEIKFYEMNHDLTLKPSVLLHFLEDLASKSAEDLGFGYTFVRENNLAWFLLKYRMEFVSYPKNIYNLKIKTEPRGYNKLFAFRDFEIYDRESLIARISSQWSLVDMTTRNIAPVSKVLSQNPNMPMYQKREDDLSFEKIPPLNSIDKQKKFEIRYDDIDVNGHVNNSNYIVWAFETLDFDFRAQKSLKTLDIVFKKEITYGDCVISGAEINDNVTNHILKSEKTGEDLCQICAKWGEK